MADETKEYAVKQTVLHKGKHIFPGETVELTDEQAKGLGDVVGPKSKAEQYSKDAEGEEKDEKPSGYNPEMSDQKPAEQKTGQEQEKDAGQSSGGTAQTTTQSQATKPATATKTTQAQSGQDKK